MSAAVYRGYFRGRARLAGAVLPSAALTLGDAGFIGGNFNNLVDFRRDIPFANLVYSSRGAWPIGEYSKGVENISPVAVKPNGWPSEDFNMVFLTGGSAADAGVYSGSFTGAATVTKPFGTPVLSAPAYNATTNKTTFTIAAGTDVDSIALEFRGLSPDFGDLELMAPGYANSNAVYRTEFVDYVASAKTIRFMDWLATNNRPDQTWAGSIASGGGRAWWYGHSVDGCADFCNANNKDAWLCVPHRFDDAGIAAFVQRVATRLDATRLVKIEFSNEIWNNKFTQFDDTLAAVKVAASIRSFSDIASCTRSGGVATLTFSAPHDKVGTLDILVAGFRGMSTEEASFTGRLVQATVTSPAVMTFPSPGPDAEANIWKNHSTFVYLDPTHRFTRPLTTFGDAGVYPDIYAAWRRYQASRTRVIHEAVVSAGIESRARAVLGIQTASAVEVWLMAWVTEEYGDASWLTLSPASYSFVVDIDSVTSATDVMTALDAYRVSKIKPALRATANTMAGWGVSVPIYEGGPHTDVLPTQPIADAIGIAHRSADMGAHIGRLIRDARDAGCTLYCHYTYGAAALGAFGQVNGNGTWPLTDAGSVEAGAASQKLAGLVAASQESAYPVPVVGETTGEIELGSAWAYNMPYSSPRADTKVVSPTFKTAPMSVLVARDADGPAQLTLNAGSQSVADWVTIEVNGVAVATQQPLAQVGNPFIEAAGEAWSGQVQMQRGMNTVTLRLKPAPRSGFVGLRSLVAAADPGGTGIGISGAIDSALLGMGGTAAGTVDIAAAMGIALAEMGGGLTGSVGELVQANFLRGNRRVARIVKREVAR